MYKTYVDSSKYKEMSEHRGMICPECADSLVPVDLNLAFVPQDKMDKGNLEKMAENNRERFCLKDE